ncbi:MAG: Skp family chaperone for outer membrane protein [Sphingobacteriales bacterium]|jgi:Skp family chaperone for outer membrane proteins
MKKIIKYALVIFLGILINTSASNAQSRESIKSYRTAYIKKKLQLTEGESTKFWPVYNTYQNELTQLRRSQKINTLNLRKDLDEVSEAELEGMIDGEIAFKQQEVDLQKKYHNKFKEVLPSPKVAALYRAEEGFKRELLKRIQEKN